MRTTESDVIDRRQRELAFLKQHVHTTTNEMASEFDVSLMTVNRDLHMFIKKGLVLHDYGDVVWIGDAMPSSQISQQRMEVLENTLKQAAGGSGRVLVSTSPLTETLTHELADRGFHVMTNQLVLPQGGADHLNQIPVLTGGQLNRFDDWLSFYGNTAVQSIKHFDADLALIYATGFSKRLLTTNTLYESVIARTMLENAQKTIVFLADNAEDYEATSMIVKRERLGRVQVIS